MDHIASIEAGTAEGRSPDEPISSFLAALAQAMHAAVARQREHIKDIVAAEARAQVEDAHARSAIEAGAMRGSADEDIRGIEAWASREVKRVRREAARRAKERRADLASYLERHETIIASEIAGVEAAVAAYGAELDRFVDDLSGADDPAEIARIADSMPTPPDLDEARARARAAAIAALEHQDDPSGPAEPMEPASDPGIGVMDPDAEGRPADLPLPADPTHVAEDEPTLVPEDEPTQVPEDEPAMFATTAGSAEHARGAIRLFRALAPWTASSPPTKEDAEAR